MSDPVLLASQEVRPPMEGEIVVVAVTNASQAVAIPAAWYGRHVTLVNDNDASAVHYLVFGDAGVVADPTAVVGDTRCGPLPAYARFDFKCLPGPTNFAVIGSVAASGYLRGWISSHA